MIDVCVINRLSSRGQYYNTFDSGAQYMRQLLRLSFTSLGVGVGEAGVVFRSLCGYIFIYISLYIPYSGIYIYPVGVAVGVVVVHIYPVGVVVLVVGGLVLTGLSWFRTFSLTAD